MIQAERITTTFSVAQALALSLCISFTQAACGESGAPTATPEATPATTPDAKPASTPSTQTSAQDAAANDTAAAEQAAPAEKAAPRFSAGMQIPVDGTSLESFEASLAEIKGQATPEEYETLEGAIQYLLVYDLSAKKDKTKLAANLNGKTGEEIVGRVNWGK